MKHQSWVSSFLGHPVFALTFRVFYLISYCICIYSMVFQAPQASEVARISFLVLLYIEDLS